MDLEKLSLQSKQRCVEIHLLTLANTVIFRSNNQYSRPAASKNFQALRQVFFLYWIILVKPIFQRLFRILIKIRITK